MRLRWLLLLAAPAAACFPFVGGIDGDRFRCQVDDDCAGDGFVCVAGVCRDPRDLRLPDAGPADAAVQDRTVDAAGDASLDAGPEAGIDASLDAARPDQGRLDSAADAARVDSARLDAGPGDWGPEDLAADDAAGEDGPPSADAAAEDGGAEDAAVADAGVDAGVTPCAQDSECTGTATSFCFAGRCAHLDVAELATDLEQVRRPSIALVDGRRPGVAYHGYSSTAANRKLGYFVHDGQQWQGPAVVDVFDDVGAEPVLAYAPDGRPWFAYRKDTTDRLRLAYYDGFTYIAADVAGSGVNDSDRAGLVIDADGTQHLLVRDTVAGLMVGQRRPSTPAAIPDEAFAWNPSFLNSMRWPALFADRPGGVLYATFVDGSRPYLALALPELGLVTTVMAPNTQAGCERLGVSTGTTSCTADRPVDLAVDSQGGLHLCTHIKNSSSDYRIFYLWLADDGFHGVELASDSDWDATHEPGVGCSIVVDALDVAHVFFTQTARRKLRHVRVVDHAPQTVGDADAPDDNGHWPDAVIDVDGVLHMAWSRVTARSNNLMSKSTLQVARLVWEGP